MKAKQVVILTNNIAVVKQKESLDQQAVELEEQDSKNFENLLDAKTIFKYNIIKKKNPNVNIVTDLINQGNIAYLLDNPLLYHFLS